jgi:competence protein ComEC
MRSLSVGILVMGLGSIAIGAETLDIHVIDTEGGKAVIIQSPEGENMLIDAGYPTPDGRDTNRIVAMATSLGIKQFDYLIATHYDADHSGNVANLVAKIPAQVFIDHGDPLPTQNPRARQMFYDPYITAIGGHKRISVKPGDTIPLKGVKITVVSAGGDVISTPLPGAGQPNESCAGAEKPTRTDTDDNGGAIGMVFEFGKFRMLDLADLLASYEYKLVCPNNLIGTVDLFMVSHHGFDFSNSQVLVHAIRAKAAIMNNGPRKGGSPAVFDILKTAPGFVDLWQLHYSPSASDKNSAEDFIANPKSPCEGKAIKVSARKDGTFTITNLRNGFSKTYKP